MYSAGGTGRRALDPKPLTNINYDKDKPKFVMKHLTKAGGTFLRIVLERILDSMHRHVTEDDTPMSPGSLRVTNKQFTAVTMRNVCDLYESCAACALFMSPLLYNNLQIHTNYC